MYLELIYLVQDIKHHGGRTFPGFKCYLIGYSDSDRIFWRREARVTTCTVLVPPNDATGSTLNLDPGQRLSAADDSFRRYIHRSGSGTTRLYYPRSRIGWLGMQSGLVPLGPGPQIHEALPYYVLLSQARTDTPF